MHAHKYNFLTMMYVYRIALIQFTNFFERWNLWRSSTTNLVKEKQPHQIRNISAVRDFSGGCVGMFVASLSATFCLVFLLKPGSQSFYRYGNHPWESSTHNHIKTQTISERLRGRGGRERVRQKWGRQREERETGRMANRQPHQTTHHIRKMDEGGGRRQFIPSSIPNFSFFLASLSACLSFIFWLPNSLFLISHCLSCSICVTSCPSVSFLFFILFLSAFLSNFKSNLTLYQAKKSHLPCISVMFLFSIALSHMQE